MIHQVVDSHMETWTAFLMPQSEPAVQKYIHIISRSGA